MNGFDPEELHHVLAASAAALVRRDGDDHLEPMLRRLCAAAADNVPGAAFAGLTMLERDGTLSSHGVSDPTIAELDRIQAELGEGPCVDTIRQPAVTTVLVDDFAVEDGRWPRFAPAARDHGVRGLLSFAMAPADAPPGALNLYSVVPRAFDEHARTIAGAFAGQAAVALYGARRISGLATAIETRDVIGQAKGILMERFGLDEQSAFDLLVRSSQDTNVKLVEVARWLVAEAARAAERRRLGADPVALPHSPPRGA